MLKAAIVQEVGKAKGGHIEETKVPLVISTHTIYYRWSLGVSSEIKATTCEYCFSANGICICNTLTYMVKKSIRRLDTNLVGLNKVKTKQLSNIQLLEYVKTDESN